MYGGGRAFSGYFLDEGEAVPTRGLPERSSRRPHRVRPMLVNLRSCASKQHVAEMGLGLGSGRVGDLQTAFFGVWGGSPRGVRGGAPRSEIYGFRVKIKHIPESK